MTAVRSSSHRLLFLSAVSFFAVSVVCVVVLWPPMPLIRFVSIASSEWILTDYRAPHDLRANSRKILAFWLSTAYAAKLASDIEGMQPHGDVERIEQALRTVQMNVLNQLQVPHDPKSWPVLLSGVGVCDQINGAACRILSHSFPRVQLFAMYDAKNNTSPHAVGRVWSRERNEWLYFDAFYDRPFVFRRGAGGRVEMLNPSTAVTDPTRDRLQPDRNVYAMDGWVLNEYHPTLAGYVLSKARLLNGDRNVPADLDYVTTPQLIIPPPGPPSPPLPINNRIFGTIASEYLRARVDDLCDDEKEAERLYQLVASDSSAASDYRAAELRLAARHFVALRSRTPSLVTSAN